MKAKQLLLTCLITMFVSFQAHAYDYDFVRDDIYYIVISADDRTVEVARSDTYSGLISIPSTVTYMGITYTVTSIGQDAFEGCSGLSSVTIGNSVTSIGEWAFSDCYGLTSVTIGNSVTSIGDYAFNSCTGLTSVTIGNSVTSIGDYAFWGCNSLTSITIPNNVTSIGERAYAACYGLTSIEVASGNSKYDSRNNCNAIIETATNTLIAGCMNTAIPNSVTNIDEWAFYHCSGLTSIYIPERVSSIDHHAFSGCNYMTDVYCYAVNVPSTHSSAFDNSNISSATLHVPAASLNAYSTTAPWSSFGTIVALSSSNIDFADANVKALCVANWDTNGDGELNEAEAEAVTSLGTVFRENTTITSFNELQYFTGLTSIGDSAFDGCSGLTSITIPESVTSIGNYAFWGCTSLTSVTIPNSVTSIGVEAFEGCYGLISVTIGNSVTSIGDMAFHGCSSLTSVAISNSVTSIGKYAFAVCSSLTSVTIPSSVTSIGYGAFSGYRSLSSIIVESGNIVYDSRNNCNAIIETATNTLIFGCQNTIIPEDVTSIGDGAFSACSGLTLITIPEGVASIGSYAFQYCSSLTDVYCYAVNVPSTHSSAFDNSNISSATLHVPAASLNAYSTTAPWSNFGTIVALSSSNIDFADANVKALCVANWDTNGDSELSEAEAAAVTDLGEVFIGNTEITSFDELQYFTGLTSIGDYAFSDCSSLTSVSIPNSVTSLGISVFNGCSGLTSVTIGSNVTSIGDYAFYGCSSLTSISIPESVTEIGEFAFYECGLTSVTLPNSLTTIGMRAFCGCFDLTSVVFPESLTSIGDCAFRGCGLTSVTFPNSLTSIGSRSFSYCDNLTSVTFPENLTSIDFGAFTGCNSLISISLPESLTSIGEYAFDGCGLTSVSIPNNVTSIGVDAFGSNLISISLNCENIGEGWFWGLESLQDLTIGDNVKTIGANAFRHCTGLTSVNIPESVTSIGVAAFSGCTSMTDVYCYATVPPCAYNEEWEEYGFDISYIKENTTLHVPAASLNAYRTTAPWSSFARIVPIDGYVINDETTSFSIAAEGSGDVIFTHNFTGDWEALYLPFVIKYDNIKADFDLAEIDGVVQNDDDNDGIADITVLSIMGFKEQNTMPNTPYLIRAKSAGEQTIVFNNVTLYPTEAATFDCSSFSIRYEFTGSYNTLGASALINRYIVQGGELVKGASKLSPCRWYMTATSKTGGAVNLPNKIRIMPVEDVITGVSLTPALSEEEEAIYNVAGQRLNKMQKGINIRNGKKVLIK